MTFKIEPKQTTVREVLEQSKSLNVLAKAKERKNRLSYIAIEGNSKNLLQLRRQSTIVQVTDRGQQASESKEKIIKEDEQQEDGWDFQNVAIPKTKHTIDLRLKVLPTKQEW